MLLAYQAFERGVATFYDLPGIPITDVIDGDGRSVKDWYLLDCCYVLERLTGPEEKFNRSDVGLRFPHLLDIASRLESVGISVSDASVFNPADPERFKFIDFGLT